MSSLRDSWLLALDADGYSAATLTSYGAGLSSLVDFLGPEASPLEVSRDDIRRWLIAERDGKSASTARARFAVVRHFFRWMVGDDRAADVWEPLLAIADLAGGQWPTVARASSLELADKSDDDSWAIVLLEHLRDVFGDHARLPTEDILKALVAREDGPWGDWWGSHVDESETKGPASQLARNLKPFEVAPKKVRFDESTTARGYLRADLEQVWARYLPLSLRKDGIRNKPTPKTLVLTRDVPLFRLFRLLTREPERNTTARASFPWG